MGLISQNTPGDIATVNQTGKFIDKIRAKKVKKLKIITVHEDSDYYQIFMASDWSMGERKKAYFLLFDDVTPTIHNTSLKLLILNTISSCSCSFSCFNIIHSDETINHSGMFETVLRINTFRWRNFFC